jgi:hypothetical protein
MKATARLAIATLTSATAAAVGALVAPAPSLAAGDQVSCRVTNQFTCTTVPLDLAGGYGGFQVATAGAASNSWVIVRDLNRPGHPEVLNEGPNWTGGQHNHWRTGAHSRYRAELHCPTGCQNATLYFTRYR